MVKESNPLGPGDHYRTVMVDRFERQYWLHVPAMTARSGNLPVVLAFHGGGSNAEQMIDFCGLNEKADREGFLAVYPQGSGRVERARTWNAGNCCGYAQRHGMDETEFIQRLLDDLARLVPVDANRIYATGMSNGGMLCYRLASEMADRIAAIAPVAGVMGTEDCSPSHPVPVCHFHGTEDQFVPYHGGRGTRSLSRTNFFSVERSIGCWVQANGCREAPEAADLPIQVDDGTRVTRAIYGGGREGAEVVLYTIHGGGHTWPGREPVLRYLGRATGNLLANEVMWEFFRRFRK